MPDGTVVMVKGALVGQPNEEVLSLGIEDQDKLTGHERAILRHARIMDKMAQFRRW